MRKNAWFVPVYYLLCMATICQTSYLSSLQTKIDSMQKEIDTLKHSYPLAGLSPFAHFQGHFSGSYSSGSTLTGWQAVPNLCFGMDLVNGGVVVPFSGIYYIYGQLLFDPVSSNSRCVFELKVNSGYIARSFSYLSSRSGSEDHTSYTGAFRFLNRGDVLTMVMVTTCKLEYYHSEESFLGAFFVGHNFDDNSGSPAALSYYSYSGTRSTDAVIYSFGSSYVGTFNGASVSTSSSYSYVTLPKIGLYFVFGQLQLNPSSSSDTCGFALKRYGYSTRLAGTYFQNGANDDRSQYVGIVVSVASASRSYRLQAWPGCYFSNQYTRGSFLGAFYLPFQKGPAIHLAGSYSGTVYRGNTLSGSWSTVVSNGGMTTAATGFSVPKGGIYFVYSQLHLDPTSSSMTKCGYEIKAGSTIVAAAQSWVASGAGRDKIVYTAGTARLSQGSIVTIKMRGYCYLRNDGGDNFLGGFSISQDTV